MRRAIFRPVWEKTGHRDGYCSIEVTPTLAHDTQGTVVEARRLWKKLGVPNVMVKIPGTVEGVPAIEQCVSEGLNINVTLLFSQDAYVAVAEAYIRGLEKRAARGEDVSESASVASFFVSRIDTLVEKTIASRREGRGHALGRRPSSTRSRARWPSPTPSRPTRSTRSCSRRRAGRRSPTREPRRSGCSGPAPAPRIPSTRDVLYVEELIGPDTVNTIRPATLDAFRDHGKARRTLDEGLERGAMR